MAIFDSLSPRLRAACAATGVLVHDVKMQLDFGYTEDEILEMIYSS